MEDQLNQPATKGDVAMLAMRTATAAQMISAMALALHRRDETGFQANWKALQNSAAELVQFAEELSGLKLTD